MPLVFLPLGLGGGDQFAQVAVPRVPTRNGRFEQVEGQGSVIAMDATIEFLKQHQDSDTPMFAVTWFPSPSRWIWMSSSTPASGPPPTAFPSSVTSNVPSALADLVDNGIDVAIEATGQPSVMRQALECVRPRGGRISPSSECACHDSTKRANRHRPWLRP